MQRNALHPAGLGSLAAEPALLERIGNALIAEVSPMWDKRDLLVTAASLACAGSGATTSLARHLFRHLSPRLGTDPGVTEKSTASQLKAVLKRWDLPQTGKKDELWRRICEQTGDSVRDAQGRPPQHCLISAAARAELRGWGCLRISQTAAKSMFELTTSELKDLPYRWEGRGGFAGKMYLLRDAKRKAVERWGTWGNLRASQVRWYAHVPPTHSANVQQEQQQEQKQQEQQQQQQQQEPAASD